MESARDLFAAGRRSEHLHTEAFTLAQFTAEAGTVDGTVRFGASEIGVASDGTTLLLQAEAAGLTPLTDAAWASATPAPAGCARASSAMR